MPGNRVRFEADMTDKVTPKIKTIKSGFDGIKTSAGFKSLVEGVGMGAGIAAFNSFGAAVSGTVGFLGDAVGAALEEEASVSKLTASLRANIPQWDGQTAAIEKTVQARMALGFSDEEQRQSLALLVGATHDINKALAIESTAMDLARFKGISLSEASEALTKVEAGSYRVLKSLGIVLKDGATQQDALNAVQKVASGQAEDYANTTGGKLLIAQTKVNEAMEKLGNVLLPVVAEAADNVVKVLDRQSISYEETAAAAAKGSVAAQVHLENLQRTLDMTGKSAGKLADDTETAMSDMSTYSNRTADDIEKDNKDIRDSWDKTVSALKSDTSSLIDDVYDPTIARSQLAAEKDELAAARRILASKTASRAQKQDATDTLDHLFKENKELYLQLIESGDITQTEYDKLMTTLKRKSAGATGKAKRDIDELIAHIKKLHDLQVSINIGVKIHETGVGASVHEGGAATGGYRPPGWSGTVGEEGTEGLHALPGGGVYVTPNAMTQSSDGGGGTTVIQLVVDGRVLAEVVDKGMGYDFQRSVPSQL